MYLEHSARSTGCEAGSHACCMSPAQGRGSKRSCEFVRFAGAPSGPGGAGKHPKI